MDLDTRRFSLGQVAKICDVDAKLAANWSDHGLADPYGAEPKKRGRGLARTYTLRDVFRFGLMAEFANLSIPYHSGRRIINGILGAFNPENPGVWIVRSDVHTSPEAPSSALSRWCKDTEEARRLIDTFRIKTALVVNVALVLDDILETIKHLEEKSE